MTLAEREGAVQDQLVPRGSKCRTGEPSLCLQWSVGETGCGRVRAVLGVGHGAWGHRLTEHAWHVVGSVGLRWLVLKARQVGLARALWTCPGWGCPP